MPSAPPPLPPTPAPSTSLLEDIASELFSVLEVGAREGLPGLRKHLAEDPLGVLAAALFVSLLVYLGAYLLMALARAVLRTLCCQGGASAGRKAEEKADRGSSGSGSGSGDSSRCCSCCCLRACARFGRMSPRARILSVAGFAALVTAAYSGGAILNARLDALRPERNPLGTERSGFYFSRAEIASIANEARARGGSAAQMMGNVTKTFLERYPGVAHDTEWIFIRAGGWMGAFRLLYASTSEYVLLFGTAIHTSGHSGRYYATIEDTILTGRFAQWSEGDVEAVVHGPGATVVHERFAATGVEWDAGTWMLEHGIGAIPSTLPFALGDVLLSAQDFYAAWRMIVVYARLIIDSALHGRF